MRINNNITALTAYNNLSRTDRSMGKNLERLSSGLRINRAADDAAGLSISEKMRAQIKGLNQAIRNAQDGISLIQTAEGALSETHSILQRMRELVVQAGNGTNEKEDFDAIQKEIDSLVAELDGIAERTEFNSKKVLDGTYASGGTKILALQIGPNTDQMVTFNIGDMSASGLGVDGLTISNFTSHSGADAMQSGFNTVLTKIDTAIGTVSSERSSLGALQNRLEHTIANLTAQAENLTAAESRIRDLDMAQEMAEFTKNQILIQAGTSMLAQANMKSQSVLNLLG